tara:strand:- start:318 stop:431 length:114 start_codon:yes stop_codon:yes gene_type:complete
MTPEEKKELKFVLQTVKEVVIFYSIIIVFLLIVKKCL